MAKVVYNDCYGGFGLSDEGIRRYAERKGIRLYPEKDERFSTITYWTKPKDERGAILTTDEWNSASIEDRKASNAAYGAAVLTDRDIPRTDPDLVAVVEELGDRASAQYAKLRIRELPDGAQYRIDEYDGNEAVETPRDIAWMVA